MSTSTHSRLLRLAVAALALSTQTLLAAWTVSVADPGGAVGEDASLRLHGGNPVISYYDAGLGDVKLATCVAGCATATPTWVFATVDSGSDVGWYTSLQLDDGRPVVTYRDMTNRDLKIATCTADCRTAAPTWVINTIDSAGDVGLFTSLQLDGGRPVVAYRDYTNGDLKLATCTAGCATASPTWVIVRIDAAGDVGRGASLQLNAGKPVVAYYDVTNKRAKLASCTANCATATPTWVFADIDRTGGEDVRFSLQLDGGGNPVVSYFAATGMKLATCTAGCGTESPAWVISTIETGGASDLSTGQWSSLSLALGYPVVSYYGNGSLKVAACTAGCATSEATWAISVVHTGVVDTGWYPSLQVEGGRMFVSFWDFDNYDLMLAVSELGGAPAGNYQGLWWRSPAGSESGWGVNLAHQGDVLFATWFTYDAAGDGMWLVMSNGARTGAGAYSGTLYRTTGPAFHATPWNADQVGVIPVGTARFAFTDRDNGVFSYSVDGVEQSKPIVRQVFAAAVPECSAGGPQGAAPNFQDLWWASPAGSESGWGVNLTHQGDIVFATWFSYGSAGKAAWLVMSHGAKTGPSTYTGALYRTRGPSFAAMPWDPAQVTTVPVGNATFTFADSGSGTFAYSVDGVSQTKAITRQAFSAPVTVCR
jgi:hypothetical protein